MTEPSQSTGPAPLGLVIALAEYDPGSDLPDLPSENTVEEACQFVDWLVKARGTPPQNIRYCGSPQPAPGKLPRDVVKRGGTRNEIVQSVREFGQTELGLDSMRELYAYISGHGFSVQGEIILPSQDYLADDGGGCLNLTNLERYFMLTIGPANLFWFVNTCRTVLDDLPGVSPLKAKPTASKGFGETIYLYAAIEGARARTSSEFSSALVAGLYGKGAAKRWVDKAYWVTFDALVGVVQAAMGSAELDPDRGRSDRKTLPLTEVADVPLTVAVADFRPDQRLRLRCWDAQRRASIDLHQPEQQVTVPPGRWNFELTDLDLDVALPLIWPPLAEPADIPIYEDCAPDELRLEFSAAPGQALPAFDRSEERVDEYWAEPGQLEQSSPPGLRGAPLPAHAPRALRSPKRPPAARSAKEPITPDPDPALVLSMQAVAGIGCTQGMPDAGALKRFGDLGRDDAAVYVVAPAAAGIVRLGTSDEAAQVLSPVEDCDPAASDARFYVSPGPLRIWMRLPGNEIMVQTAALRGRVTVLVVQPDTSPEGKPEAWAVRQHTVSPRQWSAADVDLQRIRFAALLQRRMSQNRPAMVERLDRENLDLWRILIAGPWDDPLQTLLAGYELIRRGELTAASGARLTRLLQRLDRYLDVLTADLSILHGLATGTDATVTTTPTVCDGALRAQDATDDIPAGASLTYGSIWTTWRPRLENPLPPTWQRGRTRPPIGVGIAPGGPDTGYLFQRGQLLLKATERPSAEMALQSLRLSPSWSTIAGLEGGGHLLCTLPESVSIPALISWLHARPTHRVPSAQPVHVFASSRTADEGFLDELSLARLLATGDLGTGNQLAGYSHADHKPAVLAYAARSGGSHGARLTTAIGRDQSRRKFWHVSRQ
jgi:hypothetical protein